MSVTATLSITDTGRMYTYVQAGVSVTHERTVTFDVFAPSTPGNYPVVFWSHGHLLATSGANFNIPSQWADAGYIVVVPTHLDSVDNPEQGSSLDDRFPLTDPEWSVQRVEDMEFAYDQFATILAKLNTVKAGYTGNLGEATIAGHSQGAFTAALLTGAVSDIPELQGLADTRFKQAVLVSPQGAVTGDSWHGFYYNSDTDNSWVGATVPTLILTGVDDSGTDGQTYLSRLDGFDYAPVGDKFAMVVTGASHLEMGGIGDAAVTTQVVAAATTFANAYAKNNATALASLVNVDAYQAAHTLVREVYEKAGVSHGGTAHGHGILVGTSGADVLTGSTTDDKILGNGGNDTLKGGAGDDTLIGGAGADTMTGGPGNDTFVFNAIGDSGTTSTTRDKITDFHDNGADKIDLRTIDAVAGGTDNAFVWLGITTFSAVGQVNLATSGTSVLVQLNTSGTSVAESTIELVATTVGSGAGQVNSGGGEFLL
jgi:Ca2+-binding RTX toxin-like protein